jgi:hypothetical protein
MQRKTLRHVDDARAELGQPLGVDRRGGRFGGFVAQEPAPVHRVLVADQPSEAGTCEVPASRPARYCSMNPVASASGQRALAHQAIGIDLPRSGMLADDLVHHRLRRGRFVGLVVAEAAIADEVDDDVLLEFHAVGQRLARDEHHRLRIIRVHVEDRRLEHLGHVAAIHRRTRIARIVRGEAHLVVDDQVHRAAGVEGAGLRDLQRFHDHALAGERRIAVDQHGQHALVA